MNRMFATPTKVPAIPLNPRMAAIRAMICQAIANCNLISLLEIQSQCLADGNKHQALSSTDASFHEVGPFCIQSGRCAIAVRIRSLCGFAHCARQFTGEQTGGILDFWPNILRHD